MIMARKRASVNVNSARTALGNDILDRILQAEPVSEGDTAIMEIPLDLIMPNPYQTRRVFDGDALQELATSIQNQGFYGYLLARPAEDGYQIAYGERRLRASKLAGLSTLPLVIRDFNDFQMMEVAVTENVIREDLNPMEEAEAYQHLVNANYSLRKISERVGKSIGHISTLLSLHKEADIAEALRFERIGVWAAREIAKVDNPQRRQDLIGRSARGELNREALKVAVSLALQEADYHQQQDVVVTTTQGGEKIVLRGEDATSPPPQHADETSLPPLADLHIYDPQPNLRVALSRLEKIRADRFDEIDTFNRGDVMALLKEISARAQYLLSVLDAPWEPPDNE
jgi:ParB family chromosome partitioning protein